MAACACVLASTGSPTALLPRDHRYLAVNTTTPGPSGVVSTVRIGISFISVDNAKNNLVVQQQVAGYVASLATAARVMPW